MTANACDTTSTDHDEHATWLLERARHETDPAEAASLREQVLAATHEMATDSAERFEEQGVDRRDLDQVAMLALVRSIRRYRFEQGDTFSDAAASLITGDLTRYVRQHGQLVAPPRRDDELDRDDDVALVSLCSTMGIDSRGREARAPRSRSLVTTIRDRAGIDVVRVPRTLLVLLAHLRASRTR